MAQFSLEAIVLRHANYRDNDRMLTLLSPTHGRVEALSRGCRRPKSALLSASEAFASGEFTLYQRLDKYLLTGSAIRETFYPLRLSPYRLTCATYALQLCEAAAQPGEDCARLYALLLAALRAMCGGLRDEPLKAVDAFLIRFADVLGYRPTLNACAVCGEIVPDAPSVSFDLEAGGVCCRTCAQLHALRVTRVQRDWMRRVLGDAPEETPSARENAPASGDEAPEAAALFEILRRYVESRMETTIRSSRFLP